MEEYKVIIESGRVGEYEIEKALSHLRSMDGVSIDKVIYDNNHGLTIKRNGHWGSDGSDDIKIKNIEEMKKFVYNRNLYGSGTEILSFHKEEYTEKYFEK